MSFSLSKNCQPETFEEDIYLEWEKANLFNPDFFSDCKQKYCNILPPPNANGELHLGHASGYTFMDIIGRFQRMSGKQTLLLPGKDHAGIQTQVVYERKLKNEQGLSRKDLGREKFYQEIYAFCQDRMVYMRKQEKKIGISADWSREKFTLDPQIVAIVLETFVKMYNEKDKKTGRRLAYRGERIINWCPRCATALSDFEVEHEEQESFLYTFKYDQDFPFPISTTRPETKLGDTAIAVNPKDKRYAKFVGQTFKVNFCNVELTLKIITDKNVEPNFGVGALGVTPAHSLIDWEMAQKNQLSVIPVIDEKGMIKPGFGSFSGKNVLEARKQIIQQLKEKGLLLKEEKINNNLSVCERCKTPIEPLPSKQWFIDMDHPNFSFKKAAREIIKKNKIKIYPQRFKKIMLSWIDNVHDWCISRQIWWGPQIPAWYNQKNQIKVQTNSPGPDWRQDKDTFDTWFSSGQWAYSTLGGLKGEDFKKFYPSQTMIMGRDILPLWAFRMIILSLYRTGKIPFEKLYFTGLVRDEKGQKMSKSRGNGIEPLEMIKKYGADAVRLSFVIGSTPGNDINLGENKISGFRNLINKIWNISRFILARQTQEDYRNSTLPSNNLTLADHWILTEMRILIENISKDLKDFRFSSAGEKLRDFTWNKLADWYLEACKFEKNIQEKNQILLFLLQDLLKLWHPFIPFVTEKIWQEFDFSKPLIISSWPEKKIYPANPRAQEEFDLIQKIIVALRNFRSQAKLQPEQIINISLYSQKYFALLEKQKTLISHLRTNVSIRKVSSQKEKNKKSLSLFIKGIEICINLENLFDLAQEIDRVKKELAETKIFLENLNKRLKNKKFLQKAPKSVIKEEQKRQKIYQEKIEKNKNYLHYLEKIL